MIELLDFLQDSRVTSIQSTDRGLLVHFEEDDEYEGYGYEYTSYPDYLRANRIPILFKAGESHLLILSEN